MLSTHGLPRPLLTAASLVLATGALAGQSQPPWVATEVERLFAIDPQGSDDFGESVGLFGNTAVVGASEDDHVQYSGEDEGAAYVFELGGGGAFKLVAGDPGPDTEFGAAVAIFGDTILVGAPEDDEGAPFARFVHGMALDPLTNTLYGAEIDQLVVIDPATGERTIVGPIGSSGINALAFDPGTGILYGAKLSTDELIVIDTATGAGKVVGYMGPIQGIGGLALDPSSGTLYGTAPASDTLIVIDKATGASQVVGPLGFADVWGLAFDPATNTLYGSGGSFGHVLVIDPATGAAVPVGVAGQDKVSGLALSPVPGTLYGSEISFSVAPRLVTIDAATGARAYVPVLDLGAVYVFERDQEGAGAWGEARKIRAADAQPFEAFGESVAIWGDTAVVGTTRDRHVNGAGTLPEGAAYVLERDQGGPGAWGEVAKLTAADAEPGDDFGVSVAIWGDWIVVGADYDDHDGGTGSGSAYLFARDQGGPGVWGRVARLVAGDAAPQDRFGRSVAIDGETIVIGATNDRYQPGLAGSVVYGQGSAYVYERNESGSWAEVQKLNAGDAGPGDAFGRSLAVRGPVIVVGAQTDDYGSLTSAGSAYAFARDGGVWGEVAKLTASDAESGDSFGVSIASSADKVLVGAFLDDLEALPNAGSAYVYTLAFPGETYCTAGTSASGCQAAISSSGTASATASSGFVLSTSGAEGGRNGLFYFGITGRQANPWGNGTSYQCVEPPVKRADLLSSGGTAGACDGSFAQDLNALWCPTCPKPSHNPGAGTYVQAQLWYRDPQSTSNQTTSLSDALELYVAP